MGDGSWNGWDRSEAGDVLYELLVKADGRTANPVRAGKGLADPERSQIAAGSVKKPAVGVTAPRITAGVPHAPSAEARAAQVSTPEPPSPATPDAPPAQPTTATTRLATPVRPATEKKESDDWFRRAPKQFGEGWKSEKAPSALSKTPKAGEEFHVSRFDPTHTGAPKIVKVHAVQRADDGNHVVHVTDHDGERKQLSTPQWHELMHGHFGDAYTAAVDRRVRGHARAIYTKIPKELLQDADVANLPIEQAVGKLKAHHLDAYRLVGKDLETALSRSGVTESGQARHMIAFLATRRGWHPHARASLLGAAVNGFETARLARHWKKVVVGAERAAGRGLVTDKTVADLLHGPEFKKLGIEPELQAKAEREARLLDTVHNARRRALGLSEFSSYGEAAAHNRQERAKAEQAVTGGPKGPKAKRASTPDERFGRLREAGEELHEKVLSSTAQADLPSEHPQAVPDFGMGAGRDAQGRPVPAEQWAQHQEQAYREHLAKLRGDGRLGREGPQEAQSVQSGVPPAAHAQSTPGGQTAGVRPAESVTVPPQRATAQVEPQVGGAASEARAVPPSRPQEQPEGRPSLLRRFGQAAAALVTPRGVAGPGPGPEEPAQLSADHLERKKQDYLDRFEQTRDQHHVLSSVQDEADRGVMAQDQADEIKQHLKNAHYHAVGHANLAELRGLEGEKREIGAGRDAGRYSPHTAAFIERHVERKQAQRAAWEAQKELAAFSAERTAQQSAEPVVPPARSVGADTTRAVSRRPAPAPPAEVVEAPPAEAVVPSSVSQPPKPGSPAYRATQAQGAPEPPPVEADVPEQPAEGGGPGTEQRVLDVGAPVVEEPPVPVETPEGRRTAPVAGGPGAEPVAPSDKKPASSSVSSRTSAKQRKFLGAVHVDYADALKKDPVKARKQLVAKIRAVATDKAPGDAGTAVLLGNLRKLLHEHDVRHPVVSDVAEPVVPAPVLAQQTPVTTAPVPEQPQGESVVPKSTPFKEQKAHGREKVPEVPKEVRAEKPEKPERQEADQPPDKAPAGLGAVHVGEDELLAHAEAVEDGDAFTTPYEEWTAAKRALGRHKVKVAVIERKVEENRTAAAKGKTPPHKNLPDDTPQWEHDLDEDEIEHTGAMPPEGGSLPEEQRRGFRHALHTAVHAFIENPKRSTHEVAEEAVRYVHEVHGGFPDTVEVKHVRKMLPLLVKVLDRMRWKRAAAAPTDVAATAPGTGAGTSAAAEAVLPAETGAPPREGRQGGKTPKADKGAVAEEGLDVGAPRRGQVQRRGAYEVLVPVPENVVLDFGLIAGSDKGKRMRAEARRLAHRVDQDWEQVYEPADVSGSFEKRALALRKEALVRFLNAFGAGEGQGEARDRVLAFVAKEHKRLAETVRKDFNAFLSGRMSNVFAGEGPPEEEVPAQDASGVNPFNKAVLLTSWARTSFAAEALCG